MTNKPFYRSKLAVAVASTSFVLAANAVAQDDFVPPEVEFEGLEEVVVTGKMGTSTLQDTPIALSVLSGGALADQGITNMQNLAESIPGLSLESGAGTGGAAAPYIRGVGQRDTNETLEPGVAIYLDDVYLGRPDGALLDMVDVENVQVLRGPQGTLFGKNATGGAMVITSNKPTEDFEGNVMVRLGNMGRQDMQLNLNIPLIDDKLYSRLSISTVERDGYSRRYEVIRDANGVPLDSNGVQVPNPQLPPPAPPALYTYQATDDYWDNEDRQLIYGRLRWLASDNVTVDFAYQWGKQDEKGRAGHCIYVADQLYDQNGNSLFRQPNGANNAPLNGMDGLPGLPTAIQFTSKNDYGTSCMSQELQLDEDEFASGVEGKYENDIGLFSTIVDWDIGDLGPLEATRLKTIVAWRGVETTQNQEIDGTELALIDREMTVPRDSNQYTLEFQFNFSALDGQLSGVSGLFFYDEATENGQTDARIGPFAMDEADVEEFFMDLAWHGLPPNLGILPPGSLKNPPLGMPIDAANVGPYLPFQVVTTQAGDTLGATITPSDRYDTFWFTDRAQVLDTSTFMIAAYSQMSYDINEEWTVSAGLRWNVEEKGLDTLYLEHGLKPGVVGVHTNSECLEALTLQYNDVTADGNHDGNGALGCGAVGGTDINLDRLLDNAYLAALGAANNTPADLIPPGTGFMMDTVLNPGLTPDQQLQLLRDSVTLVPSVTATSNGYESDETTDVKWTPMMNITWHGNDYVWDLFRLDSGMAYLTFSKGFKSGGIVPAGIGFLQRYEPEELDNIEFGFKIEAFDRTFRMNTAIYRMDYQDIQVTVAQSDPVNPVDVQILQSNAGAATIQGIENEITWLPIDNMMIQLNTSYTDASYDEFGYTFVPGLFNQVTMDRSDPNGFRLCDPANLGPGGNCDPVTSVNGEKVEAEPMPWVPEWSVYLAVQYTFITDNFGAITPRADASYKSDQSGHFDFYSYLSGEYEIPEFTIYNASVTWDLPDDQTRVRAWVKNIEDTRYRNGGTPIGEILGGGTTSVSAPRTYGVDVMYQF